MVIGGIGLDEDALPEDYFELSNGIEVKNLRELASAMKSMNNDDFNLHVTRSRNDFAEWIMEVYYNDKLTEKLLKCKDKGKMIQVISEAIKDNDKISKIRNPKSKKQVLRRIENMGWSGDE